MGGFCPSLVRGALILTVIVGFGGIPSTASAQVERVDTEKSSYLVYVPSGYTEQKRWPVLLAFHWSTGRATSMLKQWKDTAERRGIILLLPNSRSRMRWTKYDAQDVEAALDTVFERYSVDPDRVYATGFSSGANFSYRMMLTNPSLFRAVGPFGGRLSYRTGEFETFTRPEDTRVCVFHGTRDKTIPHKHARRARMRLRAKGFEVIERDFRQGHWLKTGYAEGMWQCLDGGRQDGES